MTISVQFILPYINPVRVRAQYQNGENRTAYYDGGGASTVALQAGIPFSYMAENSYAESNNLNLLSPPSTATSLAVAGIAPLPANDEYIISRLGYSSTYDRMMCFFLNIILIHKQGHIHVVHDKITNA